MHCACKWLHGPSWQWSSVGLQCQRDLTRHAVVSEWVSAEQGTVTRILLDRVVTAGGPTVCSKGLHASCGSVLARLVVGSECSGKSVGLISRELSK